MAAPFIIPFNQQPDSSSFFITGSYTIPAGKYARVTADCVQGGIFSINSNQVIITENTPSYGISNGGGTYTFPSGYIYDVCFGSPSSTTVTINGVVILNLAANAASAYFKLTSGATAQCGVPFRIVGVATPLRDLNVRDFYWVKTGDILTSTNTCRVHVELYNMIS